VIVHGDVRVVVADPAPADGFAAAVDPPALGYPSEFLDIDVRQFAGCVSLVAGGGVLATHGLTGDRGQVGHVVAA
jgi:hypothetical protein